MATNKANKKTGAVDFPNCPVCLMTLYPPIYLCQSGHSLCNPCTMQLQPPNCPLCRGPMTQMRNRTLEDLVDKAKVPCPHRTVGCPMSTPHTYLSQHVLECYYRSTVCPLAAVLGKCSWTGQHRHVIDHVKEKHLSLCKFGLENDMELGGITMRECDRRVFLVTQQNLLFIITVKVDSVQRLAYWTVQFVGPKKQAQKYNYEIHVASQHEPQRKVLFKERCSSDTMRADDIIRENYCPVLPLDVLTNFSKDDKLCFTYIIYNIFWAKGEYGAGANANDNPRSPEGAGSARLGKAPGQRFPGKRNDMGA